MSFTKLMTMYAIFQMSFKSFKALQGSSKYSKLIEKHNNQENNPQIDENAVLKAWDKREIIPLLHFWTVFAFIDLYDIYFEQFVSWFPFYYMIKTIILIWIIAPQTRGATVFFENFLTPQIEKRILFFDKIVFPALRRSIILILVKFEQLILNMTLTSVSQQELLSLDHSMEHLLRDVTREGYRRSREESIAALGQAVPEEKQRIALLDDILHEYVTDGTNDDDWTELNLMKDNSFGLRLQISTRKKDDDDDEEEDVNDQDDDSGSDSEAEATFEDL